MVHVVIIGAGIGGIPAAFEIREALGTNVDITVISDSDTFHFVPSNPWVAVGWRKPEAIKIPLAPIFQKKNIAFKVSAAKQVQPETNTVLCADGETVSYDYLVIATGPELAFDEIEGLGPEHYTHSICHVDHAEKTFSAWQDFIENPSHIVVGATQGASCFGPAYEFAFILDTELRKRKIRHKVPMTFVTPEPYIGHLGLGGVGDTKGLLESALRERHIKWITNAKLTKAIKGHLHVMECDAKGEPAAEHVLESRYAMFIPPFRGIPAVREVKGLSNPRGFILIDEYQRNPTYPNVYAIGVCVAIPPVETTPVPTGCPKTGYMIESMVTATAQNLKQALQGEAPSHKASWNAICLADFGDTGVAFVALPQIPPRNVNWSASGKWVHLAKIAFEKYFLRKVRNGVSETIYEKYLLKTIGVERLE
ncbi:MAG: FAD-dependent oxidoreductase [Hyphomicrobiales bacterium]|nr:FAD-dependent oxidoreductase [Rickettsiales bacterium]MCP5361065.1 FAD-dependent oxidoreductase [Hyphomicrobiales bacterium]